MGPAFAGTTIAGEFITASAKRSVLPPLLMSSAAKPVTARPGCRSRPAHCISNLLSECKAGSRRPVSGLSLNLTARFSPSTASAETEICLGCPTTSGCSICRVDAIPAAADHGLAVVGGNRAMILCFVSLAQVSPVEDAIAPRSIMVVKS